MALQFVQPGFYVNKCIPISFAGSWLVAAVWWGSFDKKYREESTQKEGINGDAMVQEMGTWVIQSMTMYYLTQQLGIKGALEGAKFGAMIGIFYSSLPYYMRWRWNKDVSNKATLCTFVDAIGHILFATMQGYCVTKFC